MRILTLLFSIAVMAGACAQPTAVNDKRTAESGEEPPALEKKARDREQIAECKICDFDYEAYNGELDEEEIKGLLLALNDEYLAAAIYARVNEKFGDPRPFVNIIRAEETHAEQLKALFKTYKIKIPENLWLGKAPEFESVKAACEAGVEAEIANRDLYEELFKTTKREDILFVYRNLQRASEVNHKPAFERCAAGGGTGPGNGFGRGKRGNP